MRALGSAALAIVAFVALVAAAGLIVVMLGYAPMTADDAPSALEANLAMTAVHATAQRQMGARSDPLPVTSANESSGLQVYAQNCVICHGASDGKASNIAAGFYVPAPQFATDGTEDDPEGTTFWKIRHGIRYSAMPAFGQSLSEQQTWQVAMFLTHLDHLPPAVDAQWKQLRSVGGAARPKMTM